MGYGRCWLGEVVILANSDGPSIWLVFKILGTQLDWLELNGDMRLPFAGQCEKKVTNGGDAGCWSQDGVLGDRIIGLYEADHK